MRLLRWVAIALFAFGGWASAFGDEADPSIRLPSLGSWLLDADGNPAHWLGSSYHGKTLVEPINIVIVDEFASSPEEAMGKFLEETSRDGFGEAWGHSSGYWAFIGSELFPQIADHDNSAISDGLAIQENNHGRIFGPLFDDGRYIFVAAFSRESFNLLEKLPHQFVSFNRARDEYALKLSDGEFYRIRGFYHLGNVVDDDVATTADHDGNVVVLEAIR